MSTKKPTVEQLEALVAEIEREAYQRGWDDAVRKILAAAQQGTPVAEQSAPEAPAAKQDKGATPTYDTPIIELVKQIVHDKPGLRGFQVVREITARDPSVAPEVADRTGRTSLSRLSKRGKIVQRKQRWYPAKAGADENTEDAGAKENEPAVGSLAH